MKKTPDRIKPEAALPENTPATQVINTPKEIVVLEVEDMPIGLKDDIFHVICPTCYVIVSKKGYSSHRNSKSCHSPARPPEDTPDEFSCETCHRTFQSVEANDLHEPCKSSSNYVPTRRNKRTHHTSLPMASKTMQRNAGLSTGATDNDIRQRGALARLSTMVNDKMAAIYRAALRKPNVDGTYNVNGQVMS